MEVATKEKYREIGIANFNLKTRYFDGVPIVELGGEIDCYTAPRLAKKAQEFLDDGHNHVIVDLRLVEYCDSGCLSVLVALHHQIRERGGNLALVLAGGNEYNPVRRILEITKLINHLDHRTTVEAARHLLLS